MDESPVFVLALPIGVAVFMALTVIFSTLMGYVLERREGSAKAREWFHAAECFSALLTIMGIMMSRALPGRLGPFWTGTYVFGGAAFIICRTMSRRASGP
jgi:hypothetical protein